ncbi:hypothetical protein HAX54_035973 [Datura stramonium]|uniref:RING-type E3 ubiquitin transferase n=1 Tax=Datura stramonium TaxID=4076 RepID=A0ABS8VJA1_DATST|nr:hypothetical protein [Datura stramonium]
MANLSTRSSSSSEPYHLAYYFSDDILSFAELNDGSFLPAYAYHYDMTNKGRYFVEFEDGSIVSTKNHAPYVLLKPTDEYFRLVESTISPTSFNWDEDFPDLKVGAGENAENPQRVTPTSQETEPKSTGKGDKKGVEVSEEQVDRIREELSCAICLEICFEPSTTSCGHSFCRECLRSAADICGTRCPKCRQFISNGSFYIVNTGLWNTIQLLFPKEVEARKAEGALNGGEAEHQSSVIIASHSNISSSRTSSSAQIQRRNSVNFRTRRELPSLDDDDALAWQLQREEFMLNFRTERI